ncbi:MAG: DUF3987 domain-containing protein, partial [Calothrix sp. SM1_7_51]|nr:DUF3987 domain-containing protein [Calothrix sp. SM1_7_51]
MGITGGIQPAKLRELMGDLQDTQGEWARFLFLSMTAYPHPMPEDDASFDISELLEGTYRRLMAIAANPEQEFSFDCEGQKLFQSYHYELEVAKHNEPRDGLKAAIAKHQGFAARLSGILYLLWQVRENVTPEKVIPAVFVQMGINLSKFFLGQITLFYANSGVSNSKLAPKLSQIVELAKQASDGRLSNRECSRKLKIKKDENLTLFRELELLGYGKAETKRQGFDFV